MPPTTQAKTERIDVRVSSRSKALLQEAAKVVNKSVSEFILDAGIMAANQALADRRFFQLDKTKWKEFQEGVKELSEFGGAKSKSAKDREAEQQAEQEEMAYADYLTTLLSEQIAHRTQTREQLLGVAA